MPKKKKGKKGKKSKKKGREDEAASSAAVVRFKEPEDPCVALAKLEAEIYCRTHEQRAKDREGCKCPNDPQSAIAATAITDPQNNPQEDTKTTVEGDRIKPGENEQQKDPCNYECSGPGRQSRQHSWWHRTGCRQAGQHDERYTPPPNPPLFPPPLMNMAGPSTMDPMTSMLALIMANPALMNGMRPPGQIDAGLLRDLSQPGRTLSDMNGYGGYGGRYGGFGYPCKPKCPYPGGMWRSRSDDMAHKQAQAPHSMNEATWKEEKDILCTQLRKLCDCGVDPVTETTKKESKNSTATADKAASMRGSGTQTVKDRGTEAKNASGGIEATGMNNIVADSSASVRVIKRQETEEWGHDKYNEVISHLGNEEAAAALDGEIKSVEGKTVDARKPQMR